MHDTTAEVAEKMREMIRAKSPLERVMMGLSMHAASKRLILRSILEKQPDISKVALRQELFLRFYGYDMDPAQRDAIMNHFAQLVPK